MFIGHSVLVVGDEVGQLVVWRRRGGWWPVARVHAAVQRPLALVDGAVRAVLASVRQLLARASVRVRARAVVDGAATTTAGAATASQLVARRLWRRQRWHATPAEIASAPELRLQRLTLPTETSRSSSKRTLFEHELWRRVDRPVVTLPRPAQPLRQLHETFV